MDYPVAKRSDTVQDFQSLKHGKVRVPDPYDWMDDLTGQETEVFLEAQNALLSQYLTDPTLEGPRIKLDPKTRIREFLESPENVDADLLLEILHDEAVEDQVVITTDVSRSGKYWAYNVSVGGSDCGVIKVKDIETGKTLPDRILDNKFDTKPARISWLDDRGFFYQYWKPDGEGRSPPQLRFHVLGEPQAEDEVVYEDPSSPGRCFWATVSHDGPLFNDFRKLFVTVGQHTGLYMFWTDHENDQVVGFDLKDGSLKTGIPSVDTQCLKLARVINGGRLLAVRSVDVRDQLHVFSTTDGHLLKILDAPVFTVFDVSFDQASEDMFFLELSFDRPPSLWHIGTSFSQSYLLTSFLKLQNPADFDVIHQWSPLENIRDDFYPPVLLTVGTKDEVTTNANSGKFTAALQHVARRLVKNQPIHLRVNPNLAHGGNISAKEMASIIIERWLWLQKPLDLKI